MKQFEKIFVYTSGTDGPEPLFLYQNKKAWHINLFMYQRRIQTMMSSQYFQYTRKEILPLMPNDCFSVMEVGCGAGFTLRWLKEEGICSKTIGIEYSREAAAAARENADIIICADIEIVDLDIPIASVDLLLCLDVLEHLRDPWRTLEKLQRYVRQGGVIIASIPNVRHKSVLLPLLFRKEWVYKDAGHLDIGHLRFFVRKTALQLIEQAGFVVDSVSETGIGKSCLTKYVNKHIPEFIKDLFVKQYLIRGFKP